MINMTRDEFRESVFKRDNNKCVICGKPAIDAHHIMERRLFNDGGYHIDNGASLCCIHHIEAEKTILTTDQIRTACNITKVVLPEHMYNDHVYDKWGNIINPDGTITQGELYNDVSVQKILPREIHDRVSKYDRIHSSTDIFFDKVVVVTEKMDGENTTVYQDGYVHTRSIDSKTHPSQTYVISDTRKWFFELPFGWRVCGENLYATHSIKYNNLKNYFQVFSIWDENNNCLSWDDTVEWCEILGLDYVKVLYRGVYDEDKIRSI